MAKNFLNIISYALKFIDNACKPNPQFYKDSVQQEISHKRNKAMVIFHSSTMIIVFLQILARRVSVISGLMSVMGYIFAISLALYSHRFHPQIFKLSYNVAIGLFGLLQLYYNEEGSHRTWIGGLIYPTAILFFTGSVWHFIMQALFQLICIHTMYQQRMFRSVEYLSPDDFMKSLTQASTTWAIMNVLIVLCIYLTLKDAYDRIEIVERKKNEFEKQKIFLLSFSHELRNLINSLMGNIKLASLEHISDKVGKFLRNADVCGELLLHLINNILDTGKVEIGELEINPTASNMYNTIERIWNVCSELIRGKNLVGKIMIKNNMPKFLRVDSYRLTQIFMNLVGNAVKFTDRGMIMITLEWINDMHEVGEKSFEPIPYNDEDEMSEGIFEKDQALHPFDNSFCTLSSSRTKIEEAFMSSRRNHFRQGVLKVSINDTGLGMTKEDLSRLFQKFTQVSIDPAKRKLGTGLGLFITKELCERMNGQIKVFSKEGKGSCFIFCIPLTPIDQYSTFREGSSGNLDNKDLTSLKTMIADDDQFSQLILKNYFHKLHIQVIEVVENGLEAYHAYVAHARRGDPLHLVTMDLTMPVTGGKEAAEKIRKYEEENRMEACTLIIISGNCSESEIAECMDMHGKVRANAFLKKPASLDEILHVISSLRER